MKPIAIIAALAIIALSATGCTHDDHDPTGSIRPSTEGNTATTEYDQFESEEFRHETADRSTRIKAPGFSTGYSSGIIVERGERGERTVTFTDITTNRRATLTLPGPLAEGDYDNAELIINGQPIELKALRVHSCSQYHITVLAVTASGAPVAIVVSEL